MPDAPAYGALFDRLQRSAFRSRFHLGQQEREYALKQGAEVLRSHAEDFVRKRLAPACIPGDGRQTPMRGHPVFVAQHACACCCRSCLAKWHGIPAGRELSQEQQDSIVSLLMAWIGKEMSMPAPAARQDRARRRKAAEAFQLSLLDGD
jgi:hypothetical protein